MSTASARTRLLDAALKRIREAGYTATTVDDLCAIAGVSKGAFFHHFASKEDLAVQAVAYWSEVTSSLFREAPYHRHDDPLDRVLAYLDFRRELLAGTVSEFTCLAGTLVQETHEASEAIRDACRACIRDHAQTLVADIEQAMHDRQLETDWTASSLALHTQSVIQGAFILAKAHGQAGIAEDSLRHLKRYVQQLFTTHPGDPDERSPTHP